MSRFRIDPINLRCGIQTKGGIQEFVLTFFDTVRFRWLVSMIEYKMGLLGTGGSTHPAIVVILDFLLFIFF